MRVQLKADLHVRRKHKHVRMFTRVRSAEEQGLAQAQCFSFCLCFRLCLRRPGSHVIFLVLVLALMLMLASYV